MKCPNCNSWKKRWLGGDSFECLGRFEFTNQPCGFLYADPITGSIMNQSEKRRYEESLRCPECDELTEGIGENLEHLEDLHIYSDGYKDQKGWFHPDCWVKHQKDKENQELISQKQVDLIEKVSQVPCPHCYIGPICLESDDYGYYDRLVNPRWECFNCNEVIDKKWLMSQIKPKQNQLQEAAVAANRSRRRHQTPVVGPSSDRRRSLGP